ncbi:MAG: HEAT repeat domain-containing protein [Pseudanabaenaceae cyanobacterium SKYGB_i_bin29]|nr:HEAT repeat domain-containing protein [Pseudanabaenaceae cyanobacterium SKYG29]MDW8422612.1 HEAT repeat domain-containing protein [Pseudanabaenaceae cyanobacterium SKYGB_i_bin29]
MAGVDYLIRALDRADSADSLTEVVKALAKTRSVRAIPHLIRVLSFNNPGAAVAAVDGLIAIGVEAVPHLLQQLDRHNYTARSWAIRALAGIGDPRGLVTLLGAATADFSVSVRRASARGLGLMKWYWFPPELREIAQAEVLEALLFVLEQDEEWVVRYSAVTGLEAFLPSYPPATDRVQACWQYLLHHDPVPAVRARIAYAQKNLLTPPPITPEPLTATIDWQEILARLSERKRQERLTPSDPGNYRQLAKTIVCQDL